MRDYFYRLCRDLFNALHSDERLLVNLNGEATDFVRLNHAKVRQAGHVTQNYIDLSLILPQTSQQASQTLSLTGDAHQDAKQLFAALDDLRRNVPSCPADPFLAINENVHHSEKIQTNQLPESAEVIDNICQQAGDLDLVGIYASGVIYRGFANSLGQTNWYETYSFNCDWSCYLRADKAVKSNYAGFTWQPDVFAAKLGESRRQLALLQRPAKRIAPGNYRVFLSPAAMDEVMGILSWGGFSEKAIRTKQSSFARMREKGLRLNTGFSIAESLAVGVAPDFDQFGFPRPAVTPIIQDGQLRQGIVSARTASEYGIPGTGASLDEAPCSLEVAGGDLLAADVLKTLDTGLYINNLWYLNYSDRNAGRVTGMTRFATFWVESGEIVSPIDVMRFDDSLYDFWGSRLVGLTVERDLRLSSATYGQRSTTSALLPGAVIEALTFTL